MADISYTLLENGLDFVLSAVQNLLGEPDHRQLKYAILHLHSGVELILKEKLRREHWSLVFEKVDEAKRARYESGDFYSVSWKTCLGRLKDICEIELTKEKIHPLEELKKKRNRVEHFNFTDNSDAVKSATVPVLQFLVEFINEEIGQGTFQEVEAELFREIARCFGKLNDFVGERTKEIQQQLSDPEGTLVTCPQCFQETMDVWGEVCCYFCGYTPDVDTAVEKFVGSVLGITWHDIARGEIWPVNKCPECWGETLVHLRENDGYENSPSYVCFGCGLNWGTLSTCDSCGNPFPDGERELGVCDDCWEIMMKKND